MIKTDVVIIGSEGAGARAALEVKKAGLEPLIVTKGMIGRCGSTVTAGADVDVDSKSIKEALGLNGDIRDSKETFFEDIIIEGKYINNQKLVEAHVEEAPDRVKEMMDWGMKVTNVLHGPGHRYPRGVYTSGQEMMRVLAREVKRANIKIYEHFMATDLVKKDGKVVGIVGLDLSTGEFVTISAKAVIIATGGGMMMYPVQTAPEDITGDGQAMAWRAGASLVDMEMIQFLACTFITPLAWKGLTFPFTIGPGVGGMEIWLMNKFGARFMSKWDPERMEHSTRDKLAIGIMNEVIDGLGSPAGGVYYSLKHLPDEIVDRYPIERNDPYLKPDWSFKGFQFKELIESMKKGKSIEVGPACHFFMGGIKINKQCETTLPGLYGAGEVCGGTHGGNRLSGNACTQILVQGKRAGENAAAYAKTCCHEEMSPAEVERLKQRVVGPIQRDCIGASAFELKKQIQNVAWQKVGVVRTGENLISALDDIAEIKKQIPGIGCRAKNRIYNKEWIDALQVESLITLLEMTTKSALLRKESRGAHFRRDAIKIDNENWLKNIIIDNKHGEVVTSCVPLMITSFIPPKEVVE
ncbi:MAG: FAD-binding protein [Dehalobacterium sp.]